MSRAGSGQAGSFALNLAESAAQATEAIDASLREIIIEVGSSVIRMSPVGNPEIWAQNAVASQYNKAVDDHNSDLRSDPANLTKGGRLKSGRKLNDGMNIVAPEGYVGGRFRANWHLSINVVESVTFDEVDPGGHCLLILPLFHVNGIVVSTLVPLSSGGRVSIRKRFNVDTFFEDVEWVRPTYFSAVPTIYAMLNALA
ncbi:AMP-binding protein [Pseudomonas sp. PB3P13]